MQALSPERTFYQAIGESALHPLQRRHQIVLAFSICLLNIVSQLFAQTGLAPQAPNAESQLRRIHELYIEGERSFSQRDYAAAADKFQQALALEPSSPELLSNLGIAYYLQGRFRDAAPILENAVRLNPELVPANLILGLDLVRLGKPGMAIAHLQRVLNLEPANWDALLGLASAYFARRDFEAAANVYLRALRIRPNDATAWYDIGTCFEHASEDIARQMAQADSRSVYYQRLTGEFLLHEGAELDAENVFRQAISSATPATAQGLHAALGFVLLRLKQYSQAETEFYTELKDFPGDLEARLGLAALSFDRADIEASSRELCAVYDADPGFFAAHVSFWLSALQPTPSALASLAADISASHCGTAAQLLQEEIAMPGALHGGATAFETTPRNAVFRPASGMAPLSLALAALRSGHYTRCAKSLAANPSADPTSNLTLAECACLSGRFYTGFEAARQTLKLNPRSAAAQYWEAESSKMLAQAAFARAVFLNPNSWQGHLLLGDLYRLRKQWGTARFHYEEASRLQPASPAAYLGLGTMDWQNGAFFGAEQALHKALELDPRSVQANFEMGDILVRQHRFKEALPYLRKSISSQPRLLATHADLGKCYAAAGNVTLAIEELEAALPVDRFGDLHYLLYVLFKQEGRTVLAQQALAESQRLRAQELHAEQQYLQQTQ